MIKIRFQALTMLFAMGILVGCTTTSVEDEKKSSSEVSKSTIMDASHSSRNSLNWIGTYSGSLSCEDCESLDVSVTLKDNDRYARKMLYVGKSSTPLLSSGVFKWDSTGNQITLISAKGNSQTYLVGEGRLIMLNDSGIESGELVMNQKDSNLEGIVWVLSAMGEKAVKESEQVESPTILFNTEEASFSGNASCNQYFGSYKLKGPNSISISDKMGVTKMACPDMSLEDEFLEFLPRVTSYSFEEGKLKLTNPTSQVSAWFVVGSEEV